MELKLTFDLLMLNMICCVSTSIHCICFYREMWKIITGLPLLLLLIKSWLMCDQWKLKLACPTLQPNQSFHWPWGINTEGYPNIQDRMLWSNCRQTLVSTGHIFFLYTRYLNYSHTYIVWLGEIMGALRSKSMKLISTISLTSPINEKRIQLMPGL